MSPRAFLAALVIVLSVTGLLATYSRGRHVGAAEVQARWDAARAQSAEQLASLESEYRAREQHLQQANQELSDDLHVQLDQTRSEYLLALDAVRAGTGRLRQQFRGCATDVPSTTSVAGTTHGNDDSGAGGLSAEDQAVALRIGSDANRVAAKLAACQAYVDSIQARF